MSELYPFLAVRDVDAAVAFYAAAFGAVEEGERVRAPDGPQVAVLSIEGGRLGVATEAPGLGTPSPETLRATTVRISLEVEDPDAVAQPYGMRQGRVVDPFGHHWLVGRQL